jgi:hypothetical protein
MGLFWKKYPGLTSTHSPNLVTLIPNYPPNTPAGLYLTAVQMKRNFFSNFILRLLIFLTDRGGHSVEAETLKICTDEYIMTMTVIPSNVLSESWDRCYDFLRYFRRKIQPKKNWRFWFKNKAKLCKIVIITLVFEKNANFFAENCRQSPKIGKLWS